MRSHPLTCSVFLLAGLLVSAYASARPDDDTVTVTKWVVKASTRNDPLVHEVSLYCDTKGEADAIIERHKADHAQGGDLATDPGVWINPKSVEVRVTVSNKKEATEKPPQRRENEQQSDSEKPSAKKILIDYIKRDKLVKDSKDLSTNKQSLDKERTRLEEERSQLLKMGRRLREIRSKPSTPELEREAKTLRDERDGRLKKYLKDKTDYDGRASDFEKKNTAYRSDVGNLAQGRQQEQKPANERPAGTSLEPVLGTWNMADSNGKPFTMEFRSEGTVAFSLPDQPPAVKPYRKVGPNTYFIDDLGGGEEACTFTVQGGRLSSRDGGLTGSR